ncbi:MAG: hypothetical protein HUJ27_14130 [Rhodobacteraceae bacterium]|nr:hypothetical protein [Paracoccaceae bacterium]
MNRIETKVFGEITLDNGSGLVPKGPGLVRPTEIDLADFSDEAADSDALAAFLDQLPSHMETARKRFIEDYEEIAGYIPEWLHDEANEIYVDLFPDTPDPKQITAEQLWARLNVCRMWASEGPSLTIDMQFGEWGADEMDYIMAAYFELDGTLTDLSLES